MIHLDTSVLIDAFTGPRRAARRLRQLVEAGERIFLSALVLYEWRRGPRLSQEIADQEALFPSTETVPFGSAEASMASELCRRLKRARGREIDIAIAACAIAHDSWLWTANPTDFKDIPNLKLLE